MILRASSIKAVLVTVELLIIIINMVLKTRDLCAISLSPRVYEFLGARFEGGGQGMKGGQQVNWRINDRP